MPRMCSLSLALAALLLCALTGLPAQAQLSRLPPLGSPAPASLLTVPQHKKPCLTDADHRDPCATVSIGKVRYTIAWDAQTKAITYLFTNDRALVTDTGLSVGDSCRIINDSGVRDATVPYIKWLIDPKWTGHDASLSGHDLWYAVIHRDDIDHHFGDIIGFVQTSYVKVKP